jgi:hypothetical protein
MMNPKLCNCSSRVRLVMLTNGTYVCGLCYVFKTAQEEGKLR